MYVYMYYHFSYCAYLSLAMHCNLARKKEEGFLLH